MIARAAAIVALVATPAAADVKAVSDAGFVVEHSVLINASRAQVYAAVVVPSRWWNGSHSWSGSAANMTIDPLAGGCFCEALPANKGSVEHGRVVFADPGKMFRLSAALGPLQGEAVTGTLTFKLDPGPVGDTTRLTVTYVVGGYVRSGVRGFAAPVDGVIGEQVGRLAKLFGSAPATR